MNKENLPDILKDIGLPPAEASVYIALLDGLKSVQEIIKTTGEKRPTVYYSLNSLEKRGLVSKTGKEYGNKFQVEPINKLSELVERNIRRQNSLLEKTKKLKDYYPNKRTNKKILVSYFDSLESIKSAIFYSLYSKDKKIRTIVPGSNFFHQIGEKFVEEYVSQKIEKGIKTQALWEDVPNKKTIDKYYSDSVIRQLPLDMHNSFETTIFIFDDKTLYIAPKKEHYAVLIQSHEHSKMMRSLFDVIWKNSIQVD